MKTKMTFTTIGSNKVDIERRAIDQIAEFFGIDKSEVESKCDVEIHIEGDINDNYTATVYVRVK
jgi:hypothetical protein